MLRRKLPELYGALVVALSLLVAGLSLPTPAWALATVSVLSSPNVTSSFSGNLGTVQISGMEVNPGQSDGITLTLPGGITLNQSDPISSFVSVPQYNPGTSVPNAFWAGSDNNGSVVQSTYVSRASIAAGMLSFEISAAPSSPAFSGTGSILINLPVSSVSGAASGPINISVSDTDNMIPRETSSPAMLVNNPGEGVSITTTSLPAATAGQPYSATIATNKGGYAPYTFAISSGQLPAGLALSSTAGNLSGTPATEGSNTFTVTVKDSTVYTDSQSFTLTVNPLALTAISPPAHPVAPAFSDIANSWAQSYIVKLSQAGVVSGYPNGTFRPDGTVTRVQFAKMLLTAMGEKPSQDVSVLAGFGDYGTYAAWELPWLAAAVQNHVLSGYPDATLRPDQTVTWLEAAVMMGKMIGGSASTDFTGSSSIPTWARPYVAVDLSQAKGKGLFSGGINFASDSAQSLTRAQAAAAVAVYMGL